MHKTPLAGRAEITRAGLAGDAQGDRVNHGGPDKALHHYPFDHYAAWAAEQPALHARLAGGAGAFGENISTQGWSEQHVCIGDVFRLGTAVVQVSQGRQPCWKLNVRCDWSGMARAVQTSGRTGWYYRVLEEGAVAAGDAMTLMEQPHPDFPLSRLQKALYERMLDFAELERIAALPPLADSWRDLARRRLEQRQVEDWSPRLDGATD